MLLRLHIPKKLEKLKPIAFAQKDKSHGGTNEHRWKWARSFQWRQNTSIKSSILEELPKCLRPFAHVISWINQAFPNFLSRRGKKIIVSPARNTAFFILNWPTQCKCLPKMKHLKKHWFFSISDIDCCRAASQPIP